MGSAGRVFHRHWRSLPVMLSKNPLYLLPVDKNINPVEKCIGMPSLLYEVISKPFGSESVGHGYLLCSL